MATDPGQTVEQRQLAVSARLLEAGSEGFNMALEMILDARSDSEVSCAANFLAAIPGHSEEKNRALVATIDRSPEMLTATSALVRDASESTRLRLLNFLLSIARPEEQRSAVFEMCVNFPALMRKHHQHFAACDIFLRVLPGAPNQWVEKIEKRYQNEQDDYWVHALGQIRTQSAIEALFEIAHNKKGNSQELALMMLESSGVVPETGKPSIYDSPQLGFVVANNASPHRMGEPVDYEVAVCPSHGITAELVLALAEVDNNALNSSRFFWYESPFEAGFLFARYKEELVEFPLSAVGPQGPLILFPAPLALHLEPMDRPYGFGGNAIPGYLQHQVGGPPQFVTPMRFPHCVDCGESMPFAASIDSGLSPFGELAFGGIVFGFWCKKCRVSCTVRQGL